MGWQIVIIVFDFWYPMGLKSFFISTIPLGLAITVGLAGCQGTPEGTLDILVTGEDLISQGFETKDGWQLRFDHAYVTLDQITAYQTNPPFEPGQPLQATTEVKLSAPKTVDMVAPEPVLIESVMAPVGHYNALSWEVVEPTAGPSAGSSLMLVGTAQRQDEVVNFSLGFPMALRFVCGEYVGDERKGVVSTENKTDLEITFHFHHLFGDAQKDREFNDAALGFAPLVALSGDRPLELDAAALTEALTPSQRTQLDKLLASLGHVGEGHCQEESTR